MVTETQGLETELKVPETTQEPVVTPPEDPKVKLEKELAELRQKYEQTDKGLRSAQATLTQKDRLLKEKEDLRGEIDTLKNMVKILATQRVKDADELETVAKQPTPDVNKAFLELEQQQQARENQRKIQEQIASYQSRVESLGLTENDENYWEIYKMVTNATPADFRLADIRLKKLEKEKESVPVAKKPTDSEKEIAELKAKLKKLEMANSGQLDSETGMPSGATATEEQIRKNFRENSTDPHARKAYLDLVVKKRGY